MYESMIRKPTYLDLINWYTNAVTSTMLCQRTCCSHCIEILTSVRVSNMRSLNVSLVNIVVKDESYVLAEARENSLLTLHIS